MRLIELIHITLKYIWKECIEIRGGYKHLKYISEIKTIITNISKFIIIYIKIYKTFNILKQNIRNKLCLRFILNKILYDLF